MNAINRIDKSREETIEIMKKIRDKSILTVGMVYEISPDGFGFIQTGKAVVTANYREGSKLSVMFDSWEEANQFKIKLESVD